MGLERLDCPLCLVAPVLPRGDEFICRAIALDACFHLRGAFVVEYLFLKSQSCCFHSNDDSLMYPDHFSFCPVLHSFRKDVVFIEVDGHHNVAVASLGCVGESTRLVCVDFIGEVHYANKYVGKFGGREWLEK